MYSCHLLFDHFQFALIHGPNIPGSCAILFFTVLDFTSITSHSHNWVLFLLWLHLFILAGVISPLISSSILGTYWPMKFLLQYPIILPFILFMGFSRQEYLSGLLFPFPVDHILSDLPTMTRPSWVAPWAWVSFIESDKAVVLVWLDWLDFCEYGFSVFAPWCPLATPTILLGFLLPWMRGISSPLPLLTLNVE